MNTVCRFVLNLAILAVFVTHALASLSRLRDLSGVNGNKINPLSLTIDSTSSRDEDALQTLFERISSVLLMESEYMEPLKLCIILSDIGHERMKDFCSAVVDDCMSKIRTLFVDKLATPKVMYVLSGSESLSLMDASQERIKRKIHEIRSPKKLLKSTSVSSFGNIVLFQSDPCSSSPKCDSGFGSLTFPISSGMASSDLEQMIEKKSLLRSLNKVFLSELDEVSLNAQMEYQQILSSLSSQEQLVTASIHKQRLTSEFDSILCDVKDSFQTRIKSIVKNRLTFRLDAALHQRTRLLELEGYVNRYSSNRVPIHFNLNYAHDLRAGFFEQFCLSRGPRAHGMKIPNVADFSFDSNTPVFSRSI